MGDRIPVVGREALNKNEQRALGGFFVEAPISRDSYEHIQVQVPVGMHRVGAVFDERIGLDQPIADVLEPRNYSDARQGFYTEKDLSQRFGSHMVSYTAKIDAILLTPDTLYLVEIKTHNQGVEGMHDVYEGFGQILMNHDRFAEDYPSVYVAREVKQVLLVEQSAIDPELVAPSFKERDLILFDPTRGGTLVGSL